MIIGVIGAGAWGSALAFIIKKTGNNVILLSHDDSKPNEIGLPTISDMSDLKECDAWLLVTPAAYFRQTVKSAKKFYSGNPIIICTKGIEKDSYMLMSEILAEELPECDDYGALSGPQFAGEVISGVPTGSTLAGTPKTREIGRKIFSKLYIEETDDIIGTEIGGVGKNALALISGFISVKTSGENERALIFTRGWNEIVNFGIENGAKMETFMGLAGLGDLFLSATSKTSRNYAAGFAIANNTPIGNKTVEGIYALKGLINRGRNMPILTDMYRQMNQTKMFE